MADFSEGPARRSDDVGSDGGDKPSRGRVLLVAQIAAVVIGLGVCGFGAWRVSSASAEHVRVMNEARQQLADAQSENTEAKTVSAPTVSEVSSAVEAANKAGTELAKLQTGYQDVPVGQEMTDYAENQVGKFFTEEAQHSRVAWCAKLSEPYEWHMSTSVDYEGGKVPCLWICTVGDIVVAYAQGDFDAAQGLFDDVEKRNTHDISQFGVPAALGGLHVPAGDSSSGAGTGHTHDHGSGEAAAADGTGGSNGGDASAGEV